jgi:hypothetical protein
LQALKTIWPSVTSRFAGSGKILKPIQEGCH